MTYESKKKWILPESDISQTVEPKDIVKIILKDRGIGDDDFEAFLNPDLSSIPDYTNLFDSAGAAKELIQYAKEGKKIFIHGDFDSDGICATTILWEFLYRELASHVNIDIDALPFIPNREEQGYGLSESSIEAMIEKGAEVIVTVDCGIRDKAVIQKYMKKGIKFIVTDHHQPPEDILTNLDYTIVHPMYPEKEYLEEGVSGAFVALLFMQAMRAELDLDWKFTPDTAGLDLVAISTVTDMMPLTGVNRIIVYWGIKQITNGTRMGLDTLMKVSGITKSDLKAYHFGFVLGPRINASGRIGNPLESVRLFSTSDLRQAQKISLELDTLNKRRQQLTEELFASAESQIEPESKIIIVDGKDWPEGVVGLVAGKLMEKYSLPTLVVSEREDDYKGSARSLGGFNITAALDEISDLLIKHGGHSQAAGFSIEKENFETFKLKLSKIAERDIDVDKLVASIAIDSFLTTDNATLELIQELMKLEPYGYGNKRPVFMLKDAVILEKKVMGKMNNHMKMSVRAGGLGDVSVVMFNCEEDVKQLEIDDVIDIVGNLDINEWSGKVTIQFMLKEWRRVDSVE